MLRTAVLALAIATAGCGIAHERAADDAGPPPPSDAFVPRPDAFIPPVDAWTPPFVTADHGPLPQVPDQGGVRIAHPQLVVITYADDPARRTIEDTSRWLASGTWLSDVGAEYGIGAASVIATIEFPGAAPDAITNTDIQALIRGGIADGSLPIPASGSLDDVLYVIAFPSHTTITDDLLGTSCVTHAGYHEEALAADGRAFSYVVVPSCASAMPTLSDLESEELALTHEVIEAATDARPFTGPAFEFSETSAVLSPWLYAGAELADLCEYRQGPTSVVREGGFVATRVWSNAAARAGDRDPCVPADPAVPYGAVSITPDAVQVASPGDTLRFDVAAWTTMRMPPLSVAALTDGSAMSTTFVPDATVDRSSMNDGDHATLTVRVPLDAASNTYGIVYFQVTNASGDTDFFPVVIAVP